MVERTFQFSFYKISTEEGPEWGLEHQEAFKKKLRLLRDRKNYGLDIDEFGRILSRRINRDQNNNFYFVKNDQFDRCLNYFLGYYSIKYVPSGFGLYVRGKIQGEKMFYILGLFWGPICGNDPDSKYFPNVYNDND